MFAAADTLLLLSRLISGLAFIQCLTHKLDAELRIMSRCSAFLRGLLKDGMLALLLVDREAAVRMVIAQGPPQALCASAGSFYNTDIQDPLLRRWMPISWLQWKRLRGKPRRQGRTSQASGPRCLNLEMNRRPLTFPEHAFLTFIGICWVGRKLSQALRAIKMELHCSDLALA